MLYSETDKNSCFFRRYRRIWSFFAFEGDFIYGRKKNRLKAGLKFEFVVKRSRENATSMRVPDANVCQLYQLSLQ